MRQLVNVGDPILDGPELRGDRIAVMRRGTIVEEDTPQRLFDNPTQAYTRELLSAVPGRDWQDQPTMNGAG